MAVMDKETTPFQSAQPGSEDEWEYETEPRGRILWGRIIALAIALVLAFLAGRATAGGGVSGAQYAKVKRDLAAARAQIAGQVPTPVATETTSPSPPAATSSPSAASSPGATGTTYVVKAGDTLRGIAIKFYRDPDLVDLIAQANNISDPTLLHPGTKLTIPPKP
jgi:nucleoid-associated protein YgaU